MKIIAEFNNFEELNEFVRRMSGESKTSGQQTEPMQTIPMQATPPVQTAPMQAIPPVQTAPMQTAPMQTAPPVPTTQKAYTLDDLARAAVTLMDAGRQAELVGLLQQFGVEALPLLPPEQYGAFATALRGMGANI